MRRILGVIRRWCSLSVRGYVSSIVAALLLPGSASAWNHTEQAWLQDDMPIPYCVGEEGAECAEELPSDYCIFGIDFGFQQWEEAPCVSISSEHQGVCAGPGPADFRTSFLFEALEPGVLTTTVTERLPGFSIDGDISYDTDIVFNTTGWATLDDIDSGRCIDEHSFAGVAAHEVGHLLGMAHSCEENEVCTDGAYVDALMMWTGPPCDAEDHLLGDDDRAGIAALYGPDAGFECSHEGPDGSVLGVVPFEIKCTVVSEHDRAEVVDAVWDWGDGHVGQGLDASHVYTEPANHSIQVTVEGARKTCDNGQWFDEDRAINHVTACGLPQVEFTAEHVNNATYRMVNHTDVSVFGCMHDISWQVYAGEDVVGEPVFDVPLAAWEPVVDFPEPGVYTVIANIGGPAGTGAAKLTFDVEDIRGSANGCATLGSAPLPLSIVGCLAMGVAVARRRRLPVRL